MWGATAPVPSPLAMLMTGFVSCLCVWITEKPQGRGRGSRKSLLRYTGIGATRLSICMAMSLIKLFPWHYTAVPVYNVCVETECRKVDLAIVTSIPRSTTHWAYIRGFIKRLISSYLTIGPNNVRVRTVSFDRCLYENINTFNYFL